MTDITLVIQAVKPDHFYLIPSEQYYQLVYSVPHRGALTVTYCYDFLLGFMKLHNDWEFIYAGCLY